MRMCNRGVFLKTKYSLRVLVRLLDWWRSDFGLMLSLKILSLNLVYYNWNKMPNSFSSSSYYYYYVNSGNAVQCILAINLKYSLPKDSFLLLSEFVHSCTHTSEPVNVNWLLCALLQYGFYPFRRLGWFAVRVEWFFFTPLVFCLF